MTKESDSAFPWVIKVGDTRTGESGLSKREMFAAMAMQGVVTAWSDGGLQWHDLNPKLIAQRAVSVADALIAELNKEKP